MLLWSLAWLTTVAVVSHGDSGAHTDAALLPQEHGASQATHWFTAERVDLTIGSLGGNAWWGMRANGQTEIALEAAVKGTLSTANVSAGFYGRFRGLELRLRGRYAFSLTKNYLEVRDTYGAIAAASRAGPRLHYGAVDGLAKLKEWWGIGLVRLEATVSQLFSQQSAYRFWESEANAIVGSGWVWTAEAGYLLGRDELMHPHLGPSLEVVGLSQRPEHTAGRAGLLLRWPVTDHLEARLDWLWPLWGPDHLGLRGGRPLNVGVRWMSGG